MPQRTSSADWPQWHRAYDDASSDLFARLAVVQRHVRAFLDTRPDGPIRVVSICAGEGRDLLDVLEAHPARTRVSARLVELDTTLAARARDRAEGLRVEVVEGDAGRTDAYAGAVPADLVLACGVFGNVADADVQRTVAALPALTAEGGVVVWTRHRRSPDLTPAIRDWFGAAGFVEHAFESPGEESFAVGVHRSERTPAALVPGERLFSFCR